MATGKPREVQVERESGQGQPLLPARLAAFESCPRLGTHTRLRGQC